MRTFLTKDLSTALGPNGPLLSAAFKEWKQGGECDHFEFGRLTPQKLQAHDFDIIWHVHLLPPAKTEKYYDWVKRWNMSDPRFTRSRCNRTSDTLLFFAEYKGDYLLLTIDNHAVFRSKFHEEKWATVADRWVAALRK